MGGFYFSNDITKPFHFTVSSCPGLDPAIIQNCLGLASSKMYQLMHPFLPLVKQECIVRKGYNNTEEWSATDTAGDHRATANKANDIKTCVIRIREGSENSISVIEHEFVHAFFNQYSDERGGWVRLYEELPQYMAVSDKDGRIPEEYCQYIQKRHENNTNSFDDFLRSNNSVYAVGPGHMQYLEDTNPGLIRDYIICVNNSHAEYNNCDMKRNECRDKNQPFKQYCDNAKSQCDSNLLKPCTDAYNSCLQRKDNGRELCIEALNQCWPYKSQRALCKQVQHHCDAKILSSYPECETNRTVCNTNIANDQTCNDKLQHCMKQNEPFQQPCDEEKKKCKTRVDEKCLTPLREHYNPKEFNNFLANGCKVINPPNLPKGPTTTISTPHHTPPPTNKLITESKISVPNSITITCGNNGENCRVSNYPSLNNNEKTIVTLQKKGQSNQKIDCDSGITKWLDKGRVPLIKNGISPEQVQHLEYTRCTQSKDHQTFPPVPSTVSSNIESITDIPNILNSPTYRAVSDSLTADTTFAAQNSTAVSTTPAVLATTTSMLFTTILPIVGVGMLLLIIVCVCSCYIYKRHENNKKAINRDIEKNINPDVKKAQENKIKVTTKDHKHHDIVPNKVINETQDINKKKLEKDDNNSVPLLPKEATPSHEKTQKTQLSQLLQDYREINNKVSIQNSVATGSEKLPESNSSEEDNDYDNVVYHTNDTSLELVGEIAVAQEDL